MSCKSTNSWLRVAGSKILSPLALVGLAALSGCASTPAPKALHDLLVSSFTLNGRVAVRHKDNGFSGNLYWKHGAGKDEMHLFSPLGQTVAEIRRDAAGATLEVSGVRHEAGNTADLTEKVLGWRLPLESMPFWVQGRVSPDAHAEIARDETGNIVRLSQQGWEIEYRDYRLQAGFALPYRLLMRGADMELKLVVDEWELP